jgi:hypothetical protein
MEEALAMTFEREGYLVIKDVIDAKHVQELRSFLLASLKKENQTVLFDVILTFPEIFALLRSVRLVEALKALLGENFLAVPHSSVMMNSFGHFHSDTTSAELDEQTFHKFAG